MADKLDKRVAIVTGSSSGNGRAIALALAKEGAYVVCTDLKKGALAGGYEKDIEVDTDDIITRSGGKSTFLPADASKACDVQKVVDHAVQTFGRLDIMVNNAGVFTGLHNIIEETEEQYDFTMNVNAKGIWLGSKYAITQFMKQEPITTSTGAKLRGRVVNIAYIGGLVGLALEPAYCASKGAVVNLTRELALDFAAERINVNAVCPGFLATAMVRSFLEKEDTNKLLHDLTPWPRVGSAEDVARAVTFLASDDAEWMTGSMLTVDGAFTAR
ncbi:SDR family NAD(P)-dependent oxidoreductase [Herbaspirillum seropedicae]|uniref:SDR family NAD(P)-dependent oxidoreductase n=1 Tax=Herbaspirillum seropedicae TaxID=964 RepID=UPI000847F8AE|nr:glucose 1-dehydrogenase [Herbaspirillum seropedicae]AON53782.1 oxidoreductase, short- chain dehydrogenase/reductase [Herbaspirillum seropedicae]